MEIQNLTIAIGATHTKNIHRLNRRQIRKIGSSAVYKACRKLKIKNLKPLTLVDDISMHSIGSWIDNFAYGLASAATKKNISIVGGEMASMRDSYTPGYVGVVVYVVGFKQ